MPGFLCPVCNGLHSFNLRCPTCGGELTDGGRADDYLGPYSPYRPIDDMKLTNGYPDLSLHLCVHRAFCEQCGIRLDSAVEEWRG